MATQRVANEALDKAECEAIHAATIIELMAHYAPGNEDDGEVLNRGAWIVLGMLETIRENLRIGRGSTAP